MRLFFVEHTFRIWYQFFKKIYSKKNSDNILIVSLDALGDTLIKIGMFQKLEEHFGKEKVYILCKDKWISILEKMGFQVFCFHNKKTFFGNLRNRIQLTKKLNQIGFREIFFCNHDGGILFGEEIFAEKQWKFQPNMNNSEEYVLKQDADFLNRCLGTKYEYRDILPNLESVYSLQNGENIVIGIGAANREKTMSTTNMKKIVEFLLERYPDKKIIFLGSGKKQKKYFEILCQTFPKDRCINKIDSYPIVDVIAEISKAYFFLGYDSGLSNAAFSLAKKYVLLYWHNGIMWQHPFSYVKILKGNQEFPLSDGVYGNNMINSITVSQVEEALNSLEI